MTKARLLAFPLTLALALGGATATFGQDEGADTVGPEAWEQDEAALLAYHELREALVAAGVAEGDIDAAIDTLQATEPDNPMDPDMDGEMEAGDGDGEFGQAEEDEPEMGDEEMGDEDEEESE